MEQKGKLRLKYFLKLTGKIITFLILPFVGYGFGLAIWQIILDSSIQNPRLIWFTSGFCLFAIFWLIFRRALQIVCTFEHELTHLIFGLLFLKRPHAFVVTLREGGHVKLSGSNFLITLAPYFFPTISFFILPFSFLVPKESMSAYLIVLGASVSFHLISTWRDLHWEQSDLHKAGILFSLLFLPAANLIFYGALLALVLGDKSQFVSFWSTGVRNSVDFFRLLFM